MRFCSSMFCLQKSCEQVLAAAPGAASFDSVDSSPNCGSSSESLPKASAQSPASAPLTPVALSSESLPPISKASGIPRPSPQYHDPTVNSTGSLGSALMAHASATGGIVGAKIVKAKKLDIDFDFDEALEEAATRNSTTNSLSNLPSSKHYESLID